MKGSDPADQESPGQWGFETNHSCTLCAAGGSERRTGPNKHVRMDWCGRRGSTNFRVDRCGRCGPTRT